MHMRPVSYTRRLTVSGVDRWTGYEALKNFELFQPQKSNLSGPPAFPEYFKFDRMRLPIAERACEPDAVRLDENIFHARQKGLMMPWQT